MLSLGPVSGWGFTSDPAKKTNNGLITLFSCASDDDDDEG